MIYITIYIYSYTLVTGIPSSAIGSNTVVVVIHARIKNTRTRRRRRRRMLKIFPDVRWDSAIKIVYKIILYTTLEPMQTWHGP